jgi:hypothetical protein
LAIGGSFQRGVEGAHKGVGRATGAGRVQQASPDRGEALFISAAGVANGRTVFWPAAGIKWEIRLM